LLEQFRANLQSIDEDDSRAKRTAHG